MIRLTTRAIQSMLMEFQGYCLHALPAGPVKAFVELPWYLDARQGNFQVPCIRCASSRRIDVNLWSGSPLLGDSAMGRPKVSLTRMRRIEDFLEVEPIFVGVCLKCSLGHWARAFPRGEHVP